ncbi:MAG: glycosyltransferase family 2 protein [Actinomycetota bacterium]
MSSNGLRVSIGLPVYNGEAFLTQALEALVAQDHSNIEIVISDNASTDATPRICARFLENDQRIRYHRSEFNRGAAWNFNRCLSLATAPYFKWAAYDDICAPRFVGSCLKRLVEVPGAVLAYPQTVEIDQYGEVVGDFFDGLDITEEKPHQRLRRLLSSRTEYHPIWGVMRTDDLRSSPGIGAYLASDVALLAELALRGKFCEVSERLFQRRWHPNTSINANPTLRERAAWFDPANRSKAAFPKARLTREFLLSIAASDIGRTEKARCVDVVARNWVVPYWRHIGGECRIALAEWRAGAGQSAVPGQGSSR